MAKHRNAPMPSELEREAESLFNKWLAMQGDVVNDNPFNYVYANASPELKQYYDETV